MWSQTKIRETGVRVSKRRPRQLTTISQLASKKLSGIACDGLQTNTQSYRIAVAWECIRAFISLYCGQGKGLRLLESTGN